MGNRKDFAGEAEFREPWRSWTVIEGGTGRDRRPGPPGASLEEEARHEGQAPGSPPPPSVHPDVPPTDKEKRFKLVAAFGFRVATVHASRDGVADRAEVRALLAQLLVRLYSDRQKDLKKVAA